MLYSFNLPETLVNTFSVCENLNNLEKYDIFAPDEYVPGRNIDSKY